MTPTLRSSLYRRLLAPLLLVAALSVPTACSTDDFLSRGSGGTECIRFEVAADRAVKGLRDVAASAEAVPAGRLVLRSDDSGDTLCARVVVSDFPAVDSRRDVRATRITSASDIDTFHLLAYWTKNGTAVTSTFYIDDDMVYDKGSWGSEESYYWPGAGHSLRFVAYAPADAASPVTRPDAPTSTAFHYSVPTDVAEQRDVVLATATEAGDYCQTVPLTFRHLCTAVRLEAAGALPEGTIDRVALRGVAAAGTYDIGADTPAWVPDDATADYEQELHLVTTGAETKGTALLADDATFLMLPQTLPDGATLEVTFTAAATTATHTLIADIGGKTWPEGKAVTYQLSITPAYVVDFSDSIPTLDAHYLIEPVTLTVDPSVKAWTLKSSSPTVTLVQTLTDFGEDGYWIEADRGTQTLKGTATGTVTVYAYVEENVTDSARRVTLTLIPDASPADSTTIPLKQLCPVWVEGTDFGVERIQDKTADWGFCWSDKFSITYEFSTLRIFLSWYFGYNIFKDVNYVDTYSTGRWLQGTWRYIVTFNLKDFPEVEVANSSSDGIQNTYELYTTNSVDKLTTSLDLCESWGGTISSSSQCQSRDELGNPEQYAARRCIMKNKFYRKVETGTQLGVSESQEVPAIDEADIHWYLPAVDEAQKMRDAAYPLAGDYWTSTRAVSYEGDNEHAYKVSFSGGGVSSAMEERTQKLCYRAVRKRP